MDWRDTFHWLLIQSGALGQIYSFRASYLQEWVMPHYGTPWIWRLGSLGAPIIGLSRFLMGEIKSMSASLARAVQYYC